MLNRKLYALLADLDTKKGGDFETELQLVSHTWDALTRCAPVAYMARLLTPSSRSSHQNQLQEVIRKSAGAEGTLNVLMSFALSADCDKGPGSSAPWEAC